MAAQHDNTGIHANSWFPDQSTQMTSWKLAYCWIIHSFHQAGKKAQWALASLRSFFFSLACVCAAKQLFKKKKKKSDPSTFRTKNILDAALLSCLNFTRCNIFHKIKKKCFPQEKKKTNVWSKLKFVGFLGWGYADPIIYSTNIDLVNPLYKANKLFNWSPVMLI